MYRCRVKSKFHKIKGKLKEVIGDLTDNPELGSEGTGEKIAGKVQEKIGQVKKVVTGNRCSLRNKRVK
jgi:uncharacterized protein YjbJ (UPF0337 family)